MKPSELSAFLSTTLNARLPILLKGAPGIGKTDIIKQACTAASQHLIISHPVVSDPVDYKGFPFVIDNEAHFLPFGDLNQLIKTQTPTTYFLDDLGQAPASVQAAAMQLRKEELMATGYQTWSPFWRPPTEKQIRQEYPQYWSL